MGKTWCLIIFKDKNQRRDYVSLMLEANRQLEEDGLDISKEVEDDYLLPQHYTKSKLKVQPMSTEVGKDIYVAVKT